MCNLVPDALHGLESSMDRITIHKKIVLSQAHIVTQRCDVQCLNAFLNELHLELFGLILSSKMMHPRSKDNPSGFVCVWSLNAIDRPAVDHVVAATDVLDPHSSVFFFESG